MIKILFVIRDLGQGGAEKVLVNLVNNMDRSKFDISVVALFSGGVNERFLKKDIHFRTIWSKEIPGNSKLMKILSPKQLHQLCINDAYDIEIAYLEGPAARVVSGCSNKSTKTICWIHRCFFSMNEICSSFRSKKEAIHSYGSFDKIVCVSESVKESLCCYMPVDEKTTVKYNTLEFESIVKQSKEPVPEIDTNFLKIISVGSLKTVKGFERLLNVLNLLKDEGYKYHLYLMGKGPLEKKLKQFTIDNGLLEYVTFLGYKTNPYKYVEKCDMFVCSSYSEGFSTAVTEALIVGTPVMTTHVSGMKEILGDNNEYGIIVENDENALYDGIKRVLDDPNILKHYKKQSKVRAKMFDTKETVQKVEELLITI